MRFYLLLVNIVMISLILACGPKKPTEPQQPENGNRKSPIAIASVKDDGAYIKVVYGQPYRNGRTIFGEWENYGEVWRTGANEATEITITEPILFGNEQVREGTYSLFSIPEKDSWTIILNYALGQWGSFDYDEDRDYIRIEVPTISLSSPVEIFTIEFSEPQFSSTSMSLTWDKVKVEIPIRFY